MFGVLRGNSREFGGVQGSSVKFRGVQRGSGEFGAKRRKVCAELSVFGHCGGKKKYDEKAPPATRD